MIGRDDLVAAWGNVVDVAEDVFKGRMVLPKKTFYYYVRPSVAAAHDCDFLVTSENNDDDGFAREILGSIPAGFDESKLSLHPLPSNAYGLTQLLLAPKAFHAELDGSRLSSKRDKLVLCLPIHKSEFSGTESVEEFYTLRRSVVPTYDWKRSVHPKIKIRFDNARTKGGTVGGKYVFAKYDLVTREIGNLSGADGFIEIINYRDDVIEILSPEPDFYLLIRDRDDSRREPLGRADLEKQVWAFLTD